MSASTIYGALHFADTRVGHFYRSPQRPGETFASGYVEETERAWKVWAEKNAEAVRLWSDPSLRELRQMSIDFDRLWGTDE